MNNGNPIFDLIGKQFDQFEEKEKVATEEVQVASLQPAFTIPTELLEGNYNLTQDKELNTFLKNKAVEIKMAEGASKIEMGRIFQETFEEISGKNQYDEGLYEKWLLEINWNKHTALRYRKRYSLFSLMQTETGKGFIAAAPQKMIDLINKVENKECIIAKIDEGTSRENIENLIALPLNPLVKKEEKQKVTSFYKSVFSFENKLKKMDLSEASKALEELNDIEKEIIRLKNIIKNK